MKRVIRYTVQGNNQYDQVVFPESFVKCVNVDALDHHPTPIQKQIEVMQFFTFFDEPGDANREFERFKAFRQVRKVYVRQYDGCGQITAQWLLEGASMSLKETPPVNDEFIAEWLIPFEKVTEQFIKPIPIEREVYKAPCVVCNEPTPRHVLWRWSSETWKEKGPLPLSAHGCEKHSMDEIIEAACQKHRRCMQC